MTRLTTWFLIFSASVLTPNVGLNAALLQDESLLEQFGNFIGGAFRSVAGNEDPPQQAAVMVAPGNAGAVPAERDRTEHKARLTAYSAAMQAWISTVCELSEAQQTAMKGTADTLLDEEVARFANRRAQQVNVAFPPTFPILFTNQSGIADTFSKQLLDGVMQNLLTEEQKASLKVSLADRETVHHEAFLSYIVAMCDKELFLTAEQRTLLTAELSSVKNKRLHPLYAFQPQSYYLPYEPLGPLLPRSSKNEFLEASQKQRLQDLIDSSTSDRHLIFQSTSGPDEWQNQIAEAAKTQRERFLRAAAVRVTYYRAELHLTPEQSEYLSIAGKGAAVRAVADWKETTQQTIDQMEQQMAQMGGNFGFGAQQMNTNGIDQNEIWAEAIKSVTSGAADASLKQRKEFHTAATAQMLLALLDDELWLLPDQHEKLLTLIQKSLPRNSDPTQYQEYVRDIVLLAFPLFKSREQDRNEILTITQREAWQQLQTFFQWQQQGNYMQIPLRNQGGSFGFMMSD